MDQQDPPEDRFDWGESEDERTYAQGRVPDRTYLSRSFPIDRRASRDFGQPARFIHKVFDNDHESQAVFDGNEWIICETPAGRYQFKLLVAREHGEIKELWIQRVPAIGSHGQVKVLLNLKRTDAARLIELLRNLDSIPIQGDHAVRVDDALLRDLSADPQVLASMYRRDPERFRKLISDDETARDVIAVAHRRSQVDHFRRLLVDPGFFSSERDALGDHAGREVVWQKFFERNPWIFGVTLAGQLLTSWSSDKLEQVVVGSSVAGPGKRADALLRTAGRIRSMVFAEFKTHKTPLLGKEYRSGCWTPSEELVGGVVQSQGTVHRAMRAVGERLPDLATDGGEIPGQFTYLIRPRAFLIIGQLSDLAGDAGGDHQDRIRSFELYRRHLAEPEILTFDELLARAEWFVTSTDESQ